MDLTKILSKDEQDILAAQLYRGLEKAGKLAFFAADGNSKLWNRAHGVQRELCVMHAELCGDIRLAGVTPDYWDAA